MKKLVIVIFVVLIQASGFVAAQFENPVSQEEKSTAQGNTALQPVVYIGLSTGINNFNGLLGGFIEIHPASKVTIAGGLGLGMWGYKATGGIRLYKNYPKGFFYSGSASVYTGVSGIEYEIENNNGTIQKAIIDLKPTTTINLSIGYQIGLLDNRLRIHFEGGYALALDKEPYEVTNGVLLDEESKWAIDLMSPGTIILGFGGSFGF